MKIVSFNLRCTWNKDGINSFLHRAGSILYKIDSEKPDVIAFQEGTEKNIDFLQRYLTDYDFLFHQREADYSGEGLCVAFRKKDFHLLNTYAFWLSETPAVPGSRFEEQSKYPRICHCTMLLRKEDRKRFCIYNLHLDHISESAKILGMRAALEHITEKQAADPLPFFILGDFNAKPGSETIAFCNEYQPLPIVDLTKELPSTFHNFGKEDPGRKIDYIYTDLQTAALPQSISVWDDTADGIYLSDHYPICLQIKL